MERKLKIKIILEKSQIGYIAYTNAFSRIHVTGSSVQEVKDNALKALETSFLQLEAKGKSSKAERLRNSEVQYVLEIGE